MNKTSRWLALHPNWTLLLVVLAALAPFLAKPFNIDDPLFIWTARQIHAHPADPFGFNVEWACQEFPMWKITENPPLTCYYLAGAAGMLGWSEIALHFAFLLPALAAILGTFRLARHFCHQPMLAALAALFTPVFLVSSTTVMCDVTMLAFWVWAVVFWVEGMEQRNLWKLFAAGWLIALAEMTKYYGACLIPLLAAHSLMNKRPLGQWAQFMLIPLAALCLYQYATQTAYHYSLLYGAMDYASFSQNQFGFLKIHTGLTAMAFTGGCLAVAVILMPILWRPATLATFAGSAVFIALITLVVNGMMWNKYSTLQGPARVSAQIQFVFWVTGGAGVLSLALADVWGWRDARSGLLGLWVGGTFLFAAFFNWTVNSRSLLPLAPAVGILIARRLDQNRLAGRSVEPRAAALGLAASAGLALLVARADFLLASAIRLNAEEVCRIYSSAGTSLWFQGHWGFQYYMQAQGALPLDAKHSRLKRGDHLAVPTNNTNLLPLDPRSAVLLEKIVVPETYPLTTFNEMVGAGFYASVWGPLPFAFGRVPPESVSVYRIQPLPPATAKN